MKCPRCGSSNVRRSRVRIWEVPLKPLTRRRPHRCEECRWRGWVVHEHHRHGSQRRLHVADANAPNPGEPDLSAIDESMGKTTVRRG
jgi:hypothetical protein